MSFTEWSNAKKKKEEESSKSSSATKSTSGGSGMSFTEWSNTKKTGSAITGYTDKDADSGWQKFQADQKKKREKEEEKSWFEKAIEMMGNSGDSTLPGSNITNVTNAYRNDTSYREPADNWSEQQKKDFGYLYGRNPDEAWSYAEKVNNSIAKAEKEKQEAAVKESATDGFWKGAAHTAGAIATAPLGLADYLDNYAEYVARGKVTEKPGLTPFEYSQTVTGGISQNLNEKYGTLDEKIPVIGGKGLGDVYGLGTSIAQSAMAGYTGGQFGTLVQFFGSAAAAGIDEAKRRGATDEQALTLGTLSGAAEGLAEMIGVDNLLKIGSTSTMRGLLTNLVKQGAAEGLEEGLTSLMNNFADQIVMQDKSNFNTMVRQLMANGMSEEEAKKKAWLSMANDLAFDMVAGFVSGTVHAGPQTAYQTVIENIYQPYWEGKTIMESEGSVDALKQLANEVAGVSSADMQQTISDQIGKVDGSSALQVGKLYNTVQSANNLANASANQADIAKSLERKGFDTQQANAVAEALVAKYNGQELTKAQEKTLKSVKGNKDVQAAISNIMTNTKSTMGQRSDNIRNFQKDVSIGRIAKAHGMSADEVKKIAEDVFTAPDENGSESHYEVSVDGKTIDRDGNIVNIKGISSIEKGRMVLETETGTVDAGDVSYASKGEAMVYEAVSKLEDIIDTETANKLSKHLLKLGGASSKVYVNAIEQAYTYGYYGYGRDRMTGENTLSATLTEKQRNVAYGLGEQYRNARTASDQEAISKKETTTKKVSGKVHFDGDRSSLTERQSASLSAMETVAEALGVQIHVFESQVDENGKRIGANGWYDPKDSSIHIDLHAGSKGEGVMLFTVAHELTHHIRKWSPAKFKILADFLMQEYGKKGVSVDALVRAQMEKAKRSRDYDMSYDEAYEEVIADSMETMLSDGNVMEKLAKLKQVDKSLWQKIKDFISELAAKIRKVYDGMAPDSVEGRFVAEMVDSIDKLQELFTEALVDASENYQASEQMGIEVDAKTESVSPAVAFSERTWTESDYVQEREKAAKEIANAIGVSVKKAKAYIDSVNSIAKMIAEDRVRLDYFSSPGRSSFVGNVEYGGSFDFSTLCKKRRLLTGTFTAIQKALPNTALTADEILDIRNRMKEKGLEVSCGLCYVEGSRANMGQFAKEFLKLYKQYYPDAWQPNMADVNTPDGIEWVRINHPECYEQYEYFWNHYGTLKDGDKNLFASQQKPKLYQLHTEYKGEILQKFKDDDNVEEKNLNGGIRLQSFSDFEIVHLIDTMQIIMDMSRVGLAGQAYTKVPDFAWALGDTGLKINLSLIAKGVDENGKLIFDDVEGMPIADAMRLRERYSKNVGTILVAFNDAQLLAAMADERVDFIIPFHRSQWKKSQYAAMGLPAKTKDYTYMQNEKFIKPQYHEYRGRMVKDKAVNFMPNEYWDFSKSGKENAIAYLEMCARNNKRPKFYKLLQNNGDGSYSLKADGSTDGYWKLLIDFKMYDNEGHGSPQMPVKPDFNMDEATRMLETYSGGHSNFPVAQGIVDDFVKEYKDSHKGVKYSDRDTESVSNRSLLANAFEGVAQNDIERQKIQEYKGKIDLINAEERKLTELNEKIKELSFAKGPKDTKAIRDLQFEAKQTANRISTYDKQLLRLEASKPLQDVLTREKKLAYQRAEQKGKEALAAYREKAAKTQRDLLNKYQDARQKATENREKTAMRHKIQNVVGELNNLLLNGDKKRHVPESLKKAVADALALVNMDTVGAEERAAKYAALIAKETDPDKIDAYTVTMENILRQGEKMGQRLKELRDAYEEIQESDDPDIANAYDPVIAGCMKELSQSIGNTSLRNMTIEQLSDVYDMYRMVLTRVRDANKSFLNEKKESISNLASRVVGEVRRVGGEHKYRAAILDSVMKFGWNNLKPVYAFEHIGSTTLTEAFNGVRAGEDVWAKDVTEAREYYLDKSKKYGYDSWDFKKKYRFQSASDLEFELTLEQILSLYAYSKREQAGEHLRLGGFVFDSNIETYKDTDSKSGKSILKYKVNTADAHQITTEILAEITGKLTKEQAAFVDEMQEYLSTVMGAKGNEVTMKMYGVKLFKEKFYFPLKSARQFMFEQNEVSGEVKIKNSGFTNKTVAKANNPVILSNFMDVWSGHVNDMSMYHAFVLPLEDFNRIFNYNSPKKENQPSVSVKGTIQNAYGPSAMAYVKQLITDLNGGARTDSTTGVINKMMGLFKKGSVFASLSVVVQQPSAVARAAAIVDTKYFIGPKVDHKRHKLLWNEVKKYAPVAIIKEMGYFDTNMGKSTQDFIQGKEYSGFKEKMKALVTDSDFRDEILSKAPALADEIAWCSIWDAVKRETKAKHPSMDTKSEAFLKMAGERFTEVITKTQVYDSVLSRSANMRSKDTGMKMATAFMAEPTTNINMIADALLQGKRGNRKYARATIGAVIASQILNSILVSFVYAGRDDDEDETYWEKYIGTLSGEIIDSLNPAGYIPFIKDIVSIVQGYDVERSDMAVVSDLWNAYQKLSSDKISVYRKVEGFAGSIAQIFGLPLKNIMRDVRGIYQTIDSFMSGPKTTKAGIGYAVKGAITGKTVANDQQLYEAIVSGDKAHTDRVKERFKDQSAVNSAMRSAIKERFTAGDINSETAISYLTKYAGMEEDDAYWKLQEWEYESESGDEFAKYNKFYDAVQTGKGLKAVIKEYTDNGVTESTLKTQIGDHFKPMYLEMSNTERANIKGYLLNAMTVLGDTREDAEKKISKWEFEAKYGFSHDERDDAYKSGEISAYELKTILMTVDGKTAEEADLQIRAYDWEAQGYEGATPAAVRDYNENCAAVGVPKDIYLHIRKFSNNTKNDVDAVTGKTIYYSAMKKVMAEIHAQPVTADQKDAIARSLGWSEKNIKKYKLW